RQQLSPALTRVASSKRCWALVSISALSVIAMTLWLCCLQYRGNSCEFNDAGGNGVPLAGIQRVAPRCAPASCKAGGKVPRTGTFQISWAYSRMVRSEENQGIDRKSTRLNSSHEWI